MKTLVAFIFCIAMAVGLIPAQAGPAIFECRVEQVLKVDASGKAIAWIDPYAEAFKASRLSINRDTGKVLFIAFGHAGKHGSVVTGSASDQSGAFSLIMPADVNGYGRVTIEVDDAVKTIRKPLKMTYAGKLLLGHCV